MTVSKKVARQAAQAVKSAIAPKLKSLEIEDGAALSVNDEDEAELQLLAQGALDTGWPGKFKVTISSGEDGLSINMQLTWPH